MAKQLNCDFWMYEELVAGRWVEIERQSLYDADLRHENYDLDVERWSREWYWDARQAATISFFRDPTKIDAANADQDLFGIPAEDETRQGHRALEDAIDELQNKIIEAQGRGQLAEFFPPSMYLGWAKRTGVDFPGSVLHEVEKFESGIRDRDNKDEPSQAGALRGDVSQDATDTAVSKARGPEAKLEKTLKKIILALFIRFASRWDPDDLEAVKKRLGDANLNGHARQLFEILKAIDLDVSQRTIEGHLSSAIDLLQ